MTITPYPPGHNFEYDCASASAGEPRQWHYRNATLQLTQCNVSANRANGSDSQGGGLWASNTLVVVDSSAVEANEAGSSGGGIYLDSGSAALSLEGNTSVRANTADDSGTAVFSASGGSIGVGDSTEIGIASRTMNHGSAAAGMALLAAGALRYDEGTRLVCGEGEQLWLNLSVVQTTFGEWLIDCDEVRSVGNGSSVEYAQPTCKQLQQGSSPFHTATTDCLPLQPPMLMTTGTISCVCRARAGCTRWTAATSRATAAAATAAAAAGKTRAGCIRSRACHARTAPTARTAARA